MPDRYGTARSLEPRGVLPQQARVLDTSLPLRAGEMLIEVELLNIDSASWHQLRASNGGDAEAIEAALLAFASERGKIHNPVTGSGGMLIGTVAELGPGRSEPAVGTRIATLVSLTLTPLVLDEIVQLDADSERVRVKGKAILFPSGIYAELPQDMPDEMALAILDVCGAPARMAGLAEPGMRVAVIGAGGKSGLLACAQALRSVDRAGRVLGLCWPEDSATAVKELGAEAVAVDCTEPLAVADAVAGAFDGGGAELTFVCANVAGCEGGAILATEDDGRVVFFSMATSFSAAALTAEGLGKSCELIIGNGFVPGHAELALDLVRTEPVLYQRFTSP